MLLSANKWGEAIAIIAVATLLGGTLGRLVNPQERAAHNDALFLTGKDAVMARQCLDITRQLETAFDKH